MEISPLIWRNNSKHQPEQVEEREMGSQEVQL